MAAYVGGPVYLPTSLAMGVGGDVHEFTRYKQNGAVSLHPLQRLGIVGAVSAAYGHAYKFVVRDGTTLGGSLFAAGHSMLTLPPINPVEGSPRDPSVMI